jgi:tetratricopeptide (TPR) repeat protein
VLPNEEGDWVETERAVIDRLIAQAHLLGAEAALAAGDPMTAAAGAARALDVDPYDEAALRVLMRAHVAAGRPASALGAYARVRERLVEELGASPDPATEELHTAIVRGEAVGGVTPRERPRAPVVGRERELAWLNEQLAQARGGAGRVVVVEGEAGIGKTTLVRRWASSLAAAFALVVDCDELGRDLPLQPLLDGLDIHLGGLSDVEVDEVLGPQGRIVGPFLASAAVVASPARHTELPDQGSLRAAFFAALLAVVERAAAGRPVVLVVDDAHLAGELTLAWLSFAARRGRHLLVVATRRPGEGSAFRGDASLQLGPLDVEATGVLYGTRRAAELHRRSHGHPLFLVALGESGDVGEGLPATITEAVERQVEGLGAAAPTLVAASVLGPPLDVALLADVLARPPAALLDDLEAATTARLLVERSRGFEFAHELVREALASSASAARRAFLHREAARALSSRAEREPLAVAHHARRGGDAELAARALVEAARVAGERSDHPRAVVLLDDAVGLADGPAVRLARARARLAVQDLAGAADDAEAAITRGAGVAGFELAGWISYYRRDFDAALRYAEEGAARADDPALRASCLVLAGRVVHSNGDLTGADRRLGEAAAIAPPGLRPLVGIWLGDLRVFQGRWREAADQVDRALLDRTHLAHPFALPHALMTRLRAAALGGRAGAALAVSAEALATMDELGELGARYVPAACNYRAWVLRHLGQVAEATELNERARGLTASAGMEEPFNQGTLDLADGCLLAGDTDDAVAYLGQLRGLGPDGAGADGVEGPAMAWHQRERLALIQGRLALARGRPEDARELAATLASSAAQRGSVRHARFGRVIEALARLDIGEPPATSDLENLLAQLDEVAGLEAWRIAAEVARRLGSEAAHHNAERRAAVLLAATPAPDRPALERWMRPWLDAGLR